MCTVTLFTLLWSSGPLVHSVYCVQSVYNTIANCDDLCNVLIGKSIMKKFSNNIPAYTKQ